MWLFWRLACFRIPHIRIVCCGFSNCDQPQNSLHYTIFGIIANENKRVANLTTIGNPFCLFVILLFIVE